jgi:uncharacterized protein involved in outer membrane biogenesis
MKLLRLLAVILFAPVALLFGAILVVSLFGITVNLDVIRPMVEKSASAALEREIKISGSIELLPTLTPSLEVRGVRISNPEGWGKPDFGNVQLARVQLDLPDLLSKQINIIEITAEGVRIDLESRENELNNWSFTQGAKNTNEIVESEEIISKMQERTVLSFKAVDRLYLKDIEIFYADTVLQKKINFHLEELSGKAPVGKDTTLHIEGRLENKRFSCDLNAGGLSTFHPYVAAWPFELSGTISDTSFSASGNIDKTNKEGSLSLNVIVGAVDIGELLSSLQVADNINASTEKLDLQLRLEGDSLDELLRQSAFTFILEGGTLDLGNPGGDSGVFISNLSGNVGVTPGSAVSCSLKGMVDTTPVTISILGMPFVDYIGDPEGLPATIVFTAADAELTFHGVLDLPVDSKTFSMAMTLKGEKLDSLNEFLRIDLPPFEAYSLGAQFKATDKGYDLSNLVVKLGKSDLRGSLSVNIEGEKPEVAIELASTILQLNDFSIGDWSPEDKNGSKEKGEEGANVENIAFLLSPEALTRFNMTLSLEMTKVLSGKDLLGSGILKSSLQDGRFTITPLQLDLVNGTVELDFSFYPTEEEAEIHLSSRVDRLDLGIIARRIKPEAIMGGVLYLDIELDSTARQLSELLTYGNGHFDLGFAPVNYDAGLIDLWAVNLLSALAREVDEAPSSTINCLVASFGMEDGLMQERALFLDTTHMSIEGEANIDFKTEQFKLKAVPKAKRPEFFSLATPLKVKGSFKEFGIGINKLRLTTSLLSFITSPVHVPVRRLFVGERPEDGRDACVMAWQNRNIEKETVSGKGD